MVKKISPGLHIFTAQYPQDAFYADLSFGLVVIKAVPERERGNLEQVQVVH